MRSAMHPNPPKARPFSERARCIALRIHAPYISTFLFAVPCKISSQAGLSYTEEMHVAFTGNPPSLVVRLGNAQDGAAWAEFLAVYEPLIRRARFNESPSGQRVQPRACDRAVEGHR